MKKFIRSCSAVVFSCALAFSAVGVIPANAAEVPVEQVTGIIEEAKEATAAFVKSTPTQTDLKINAELPMIGDISADVSFVDDPVNKAASVTSTLSDDEQGPSTAYIDTKNKYAYYTNPESGRIEVTDSQSIDGLTKMLSGFDITQLAPIATFSMGETKDIDGETCQELIVNVDLDKEKIAQYGELISKALADASSSPFKNLFSGKGLGSLISEDDLSNSMTELHLEIKTCINQDKVLKQAVTTCSAKVIMLGVEMPISFNADITTKAVDAVVKIPQEMIDNAKPAAGLSKTESGLTYKSVISGKNTVFQVTKTSKATAKKITVPATVNLCGKTVKVTKASKNAFSKAKKLKTLVIKNSTLKKAVKKNPKKYGLSKKVKIK